MYSNLEKSLIKAASGEDSEEEFQVLYGSNYNPQLFKTQLQLLQVYFSSTCTEKVTVATVKDSIVSLEGRSLLSEVVKVLSTILVMPATNATSERSFSAFRRIKTFLRTTMHQARLNHLMLLHIHKDLTDKLTLVE